MMENNRMMEKKKKYINVVDRFFKKHFLSIYIIRLILNLLLLNILVIYFVIHFFFNQSTQNRMNSSENFNKLYFFKTVQKNEETYENVIYAISIIYVILSLVFFILEFYIKWRKHNELKYMMGIRDNQVPGTKQNEISNKNSTHILPDQNSHYEHTLENSKTINTRQLKDLNKNKNAHTNIYITTSYIFVYILLMLLGIRQYNITEYVLYFYFMLAICEFITPLTISMKLINFVTKYYKTHFLKREKMNNNNSNMMIKKRDIYFFFCYFAILRFLKKTKIYDKIMVKKNKPIHEPDLKTENNKIEIKNKNLFSKYFAILKQNIKKKNNYIFYNYFGIFSFLKNCIIHTLHILKRWIYSHIKTKDKNKNMNETGPLLRNIETVNTDMGKREINYNSNLKENINISNIVVNNFNTPNENTKSEKENSICNKNKIAKKSLAIEKSVIKKDDLKLKGLDSSDKITSHLSMKKNELNKIIKNTNKYKDYYIKYNKYNKAINDMEEDQFEFEDDEYFVNTNLSMIEKRQFKVIENNSNDMNKYGEKKNINPNKLELKHIYDQNKDNSLYFSNTSSTEVNEKETTEADHNEESISYKDKCISKEENANKSYFSKTEYAHTTSLNINKRNTIRTHGLTYKIKKNDMGNKNISFEKNIKIILSNFKRRMEVCIFLNVIYKIALLLNILIIFFVMSIMLHINLYILTTNVKPFFFYKIISILIQCCYFVFFHLHVYEYNNMIK